MFLKEKNAWNFIQRMKKKRKDNHLKQGFVFFIFYQIHLVFFIETICKPLGAGGGGLYSAAFSSCRIFCGQHQKHERTDAQTKSDTRVEELIERNPTLFPLIFLLYLNVQTPTFPVAAKPSALRFHSCCSTSCRGRERAVSWRHLRKCKIHFSLWTTIQPSSSQIMAHDNSCAGTP